MAENTDVRGRNESGLGVVDIVGYINNVGGEKVVQTCDEFATQGVSSFILNLDGCTIVNSIGVSFLIELVEKVKEDSGRLAFCCASPTIAKTFRIMGLLQNSTVHDTEAEAFASLKG